MKQIIKAVSLAGILAVAMVAFGMSVPATTHAADYSGGNWYVDYAEPNYTDNSGNWYVDYAEPNYSDNSGNWYVDYAEPNYTDNSGNWYVDYAQPNYTYSTPGCGSNCGGGYTWQPPTCTAWCGGGCTSNCGGGCTSNCGGCTTCTCSNSCPVPEPVCTLTVNSSSLSYPGQPVTIAWTSQNAVSGSISNIGSVSTNGSRTVNPNQTTTYTGTFVNSKGHSVNCSATVVVTPIPVTPAPVCTLTVSQYNIQYPVNGTYQNNYNQSVVLSWTSNNTNSGWINQGIGNVNLSGSRTVNPTQTTTYTGTFIGQNGQQVTCSATVNVNHYVPPVTPFVTLSAVPYTGLDLGPVGTVVYWGFLIAWCVLAAYLIAVKRVHMSIYRWYNQMLFGTSTETIVSTPAMATTAGPVSAPAPVRSHTEAMDPFILSQINRAK